MNDQNKNKANDDTTGPRDPSHIGAGAIEEAAESNFARRRALIAALAATPAVLTLMSRSAFATNPNCSVVGSLAVGTSLHTGTTVNTGDRQRCNL